MKITAGILAGGKSTRMGTNKAFLSFKGTSFIENIAKKCEDFSNIIISVHDKEPYKHLDYVLVEDEMKGFGPLEGVYQILKKADTRYVLILAIDMPYISKDFLRKLYNYIDRPGFLKNSQGRPPECIVLRRGNMLEPLCSIYSKSLIPYLEQMREKGEAKLRLLYDRVYTKYIDIEDLGYTKEILSNINTMEEYKKIEK